MDNRLYVYGQRFYERFTGVPHDITVLFRYDGDKHYDVEVDDEFYSTAESRAEAREEIEDIVIANNFSPICSV